MPLVRTGIREGHSHVVALPAVLPREPSWFFTEPGGEDGHVHGVLVGGSRAGLVETDFSGHDSVCMLEDSCDPGESPTERPRGEVNPDQPDPTRRHSHTLEALL